MIFEFFIDFRKIAFLCFLYFSCRNHCSYGLNLILAVNLMFHIMAKTRGARDIDERQQNAIIEGRKQGSTHEELAQQFGILNRR